MANYGHVIFFSLIGGILSLAAGVLLLTKKRAASVLTRYSIPFAAGALLAAVFLDLLAEGLKIGSTDTVLLATLAGIVLFFLAERFLHWFHHHHQHDGDPSISLIIIGDTVHNALDGVAIAAGFLVSIPTGIVTALAVAAHELPQEVGDFGLLLSKGLSRNRVLLVNVWSAIATVIMAIITFALGSADRLPLGILLGISAGFLLYIATSDIIPSIHEKASNKRIIGIESLLLLLGIAVVGILIRLAHSLVE